MAKVKLDNTQGTPLDPFSFEKKFAKPDANNPHPFSGVTDQLEFVTPVSVEEGFGGLGNATYAQNVINEYKAHNQSGLEIAAKGIGNVAKTVGIEIAKTPGYFGGVVGAVGNELLGDGKNSMSYIVDNAWINALEKVDEAYKEFLPIHISQSVQEGNLLEKLGSGAWWATSGADGLGFMLAMFAPGAAAKALGIGSKIARVGEGLANLSPKLGKWAVGKNLMEEIGKDAFAYTKTFSRNANGYASAVLNTTLEASAEAANTFDNLKSKFISQGLSEEEASLKAGEGAAAVFKGNMALLAISNFLDERYIWKTIGSAGEKEAADTMLKNLFKDGVVDEKALAELPKKLGTTNLLKKGTINFGKGIIKEGGFEEGSQTTLQQNVEEGKIKDSVFGNLSNVASSYFDDFVNNTELHESIFLGGLLGGGASVISSVNENRALKSALYGSSGRTSDNFFVKAGILPETKAQKGLLNIVKENHIQQFRSYKDFIEQDSQGNFRLNEEKLIKANIENVDRLAIDALYDIAVAQKDKLSQEILGQQLAANYVHGFLGQEGGQELFEEHVKSQVLPAWQKRYEETFGAQPTEKQSQDYLSNFLKSGERVFEAKKLAEETNYPERYFSEASKEYSEFKQEYFHEKFNTLVNLDSLDFRKKQIEKELLESNVTREDLADLSKIVDPRVKFKAADIKQELNQIDELEKELREKYSKFFTKSGVKELFEVFKGKNKLFADVAQQIQEENEKLKEKLNKIPERNSAELNRLELIQNHHQEPNAVFKDKNGNRYTLDELKNKQEDLQNLQLSFDDVTIEEYDTFKKTGEVSQSTLKDIAKKFVDNVELSKREAEIFEAKKDEINNLVKKESAEVSNKIDKQEPISQSDEDKNYEDVVNEVDSIGKKKGVYLYPSTGRHALDKLEEVEGQPGVYIEKINPKIGQQIWFSTLNDDVSKAPQEYTVQVVRRDNKSNEELWKQLSRDSDPNNSRDGDLFVVLHKDGKPVIKDGHYVFTSLWRPENLYPLNEDGTPKQFILAEKAVLENYLLHIQQPKLNLDKLSKNQKDFFKKLNVDPTKLGIMTAAFFHAKQEYTEWYKDLQENPKMLNVAAITKGHSLKSFNEDGELYWGSLNNIPGLKLKNGKVTSGNFQVSITGTLKVGEDTLNVNPGDTFYIDSSNRPHVIKPRLINENEIRTVLYLLSLRSQPGPTESIKLSAPNPIEFGTKKHKSLPVFFNPEENQSNVTVIHSLIDFGNKKGKKGEIYFNKDSLLTEPIVVYTDFEGNTKNIKVSEIKNAVDNNDYSEIQDFYKFLEQKYFKINDRLLMNNNKFSKPSLVYTRDTSGQMQAELKWDQSKTYQEHLVDNIGTTTTISVKGKPEVIQRNLAFFKNPLPKNIEDEVQDTTETPITEDVIMNSEPNQNSKLKEDILSKIKNKKSLDEFRDDFADKILTTKDLFQQKIKNGEIKQNCK